MLWKTLGRATGQMMFFIATAGILCVGFTLFSVLAWGYYEQVR